MVKMCAHGLCLNTVNTIEEERKKNFFFIRFVRPKNDLEKCQRWVAACNRVNFIVNENNYLRTFICSHHFIGGKGPTTEFPDPIKATAAEYAYQRRKSKKRLLDESIGTGEPGAKMAHTVQLNEVERTKMSKSLIINKKNNRSLLRSQNATISTVPTLLQPCTENISGINSNPLLPGNNVNDEKPVLGNNVIDEEPVPIFQRKSKKRLLDESIGTDEPWAKMAHTVQLNEVEQTEMSKSLIINKKNSRSLLRSQNATISSVPMLCTENILGVNSNPLFLGNNVKDEKPVPENVIDEEPVLVSQCSSQNEHNEFDTKNLIKNIVLPFSWAPLFRETEIIFMKFSSTETQPIITINIGQQEGVKVKVLGEELSIENQRKLFFQDNISLAERVQSLIYRLNAFSICQGNSDSKFLSLYEGDKKNKLRYSNARYSDPDRSLHHKNCDVLNDLNRKRCTNCIKLRSSLRSALCSARKPKNDDLNSKMNARYMSRAQLQELLKISRRKVILEKKKVGRLRRKLLKEDNNERRFLQITDSDG